jgi:hypothetical protein
MRLILTILLAVAAGGCITSAVWKTTANDEYILVYRKDVSDADYQQFVEKSKSEDRSVIIGPTGDILIKKSKMERAKDYALTTLGTPVMITADASVFVVKATLKTPWVIPEILKNWH